MGFGNRLLAHSEADVEARIESVTAVPVALRCLLSSVRNSLIFFSKPQVGRSHIDPNP